MNELPDSVEVVVVGFGPVGATIANLLGQYGVRTLVVDRATNILMMPRAIALDNEALRILQLAGLSAGAFDTVAIPCVRMHSPYIGEFAQLNTAGALDGHPKLVTFYQPDLEAALRRRVREYPHVTTRLGMELVDFVDEGAGVRINLRDSDGNLATTHGRYMIGADGASSAVRRQIGMEFEGHTYAEDWLIAFPAAVPTHVVVFPATNLLRDRDGLPEEPLVLHGSSGNSSMTRRRRALATRWLGDGVVYAPRPATMPLPPDSGLRSGDRIGGRLFPTVLGADSHS